MQSSKNEIKSIGEISKDCSKWGLPHFQRGSVWEDVSISLFLESLAYDTPCGIIIIWKPLIKDGEKLSDYGISAWGEKSEIEFFVLDGQQRITTIYKLFNQGEISEWFYNPLVDPSVRLNKNSKSSLDNLGVFFKKPKEPAKDEKSIKRHRSMYNYSICVADLINFASDEKGLHDYYTNFLKPKFNSLLINEDESFFKSLVNISNMQKRTISIFTKEEDGYLNTLNDMIKLYNRINSSGVPVTDDERAFATLVSIYPKMLKWISDTYQITHPDTDESLSETNKRNVVLKRQREKAFGFKLFINTMIEYMGYHIDGIPGNYERIEKNPMHYSSHSGSEGFYKFLDITKNSLRDTSNAIRYLGCDDFRFIPELKEIKIILSVILNFDLSQIESERLLSSLLFVLYFIESNDNKIGKMQKMIMRLDNIQELLDFVSSLKINYEAIEKSKSTQSMYSNLLYWLLRMNAATDLVIDENKIINNTMKCEKQHIIPYAKLIKYYDDDKSYSSSGRIGTHDIHRIGNLTYISEKTNRELSDDMKYLLDLPLSILENHFIDQNCIELYRDIYNIIQSNEKEENEGRGDNSNFNDKKSIVIKKFDAFCQQRFSLIIKFIDSKIKKSIDSLVGFNHILSSERIFDISNEEIDKFIDNLKLSNPEIKNRVKLIFRKIQRKSIYRKNGNKFIISGNVSFRPGRIEILLSSMCIQVGLKHPNSNNIHSELNSLIGSPSFVDHSQYRWSFYSNGKKSIDMWIKALDFIATYKY
jgi:hypothetical protein